MAYLREAGTFADELDARRRAAYLYEHRPGLSTCRRPRGGDPRRNPEPGLFRSAEATIKSAGIANLLALAYLEAGSHEQARESARLGRAMAIQVGDERLRSHIADTMARIELASGQPGPAEDLADEAIDIARRIDNQAALVDAMVTKARTLLATDRAPDASRLLADAAELVKTTGPASRRRDVLSAWADAVASTGDHARAYEIMREAVVPG